VTKVLSFRLIVSSTNVSLRTGQLIAVQHAFGRRLLLGRQLAQRFAVIERSHGV
jgi:hypothetical protein